MEKQKFTIKASSAKQILTNFKLAKFLLIKENHPTLKPYFYKKHLKLNLKNFNKLDNLCKTLEFENLPKYINDYNYGLILFKSMKIFIKENYIKQSDFQKQLNLSRKISERILKNLVNEGLLIREKVIINNNRYINYKVVFNWSENVKINLDIETLKQLNYVVNKCKQSDNKTIYKCEQVKEVKEVNNKNNKKDMNLITKYNKSSNIWDPFADIVSIKKVDTLVNEPDEYELEILPFSNNAKSIKTTLSKLEEKGFKLEIKTSSYAGTRTKGVINEFIVYDANKVPVKGFKKIENDKYSYYGKEYSSAELLKHGYTFK